MPKRKAAPRKAAKLTTVDPSRHRQMFDPAVFAQKRVDVVGCGAVGSKLAMELAKLGVRNLHLWDDDIVELHNIANQLFGLPDIGKQKVKALAEHIRIATGTKPVVHPVRVTGPVEFGKVVFLAVDTMAARKEIFARSLRLKFTTDLVVEVRMGAEELRVYGFNPRTREQIDAWEKTLVDDTKTVESACRVRTTVGATAGIAACLAVHRFLQWYRSDIAQEKDVPAQLEQVMMLRPLVTLSRSAEM